MFGQKMVVALTLNMITGSNLSCIPRKDIFTRMGGSTAEPLVHAHVDRRFALMDGLCQQIVCIDGCAARGWLTPRVGLHLWLVCISGWFVLVGGLY